MNPQTHLFHRPAEPGWLVLSGAMPSLNEDAPLVMERLLSELDLSLPPVCLRMEPFAPGALDDFRDDFEELIGVDLPMLDVDEYGVDDIIATSVGAGFILLIGGEPVDWYDFLKLAPNQVLLDSFLQRGQVLMAAGAPAGALGTWLLKETGGHLMPGLGWLEGAIILPGTGTPIEIPAVQDKLKEKEPFYSLGLPKGAVLALGPADEVEVWGSIKPVVSLGIGWRA